MQSRDGRFMEGFALGQWQANCYILGDEERGTAVVVDPGQGGLEPVRERLDARGVRCEAVLLTHGHLDHLWSAPEVAAAFDAPVLLHVDDTWLYADPGAAFGQFPPGTLEAQFGLRWKPDPDALQTFTDRTTFSFAGYAITARHTPGHTPGSSVFLLDDPGLGDPLMLSGDLLFAGSVGRTDLVGGDGDTQVASLRRVVIPLEDDTVVAPGHGERTTVGTERSSNPHLRHL